MTGINAQIYAKTLPISEVDDPTRRAMYALLRLYYEQVSFEQFARDLGNKNHVILMYDKRHHRLRGFSTVRSLKLNIRYRRALGVFSGDTVVEKAYWGQRVLGKAFLRYLWCLKLRHPFIPLYWLLISKGYKTYLLMANNFTEHYPRREQATPTWAKGLMDEVYGKIFPDAYESETGLIRSIGEACRLREGVAEPNDRQAQNNPRIAYFLSQNPDWKEGVELGCIARFRLSMPLIYHLKSLGRRLSLANPVSTHPRNAMSPGAVK